MVKKASEAEILEELYDLILSKTLNSKEHEVLVKSKNNLEKEIILEGNQRSSTLSSASC